MTDMMTMNTIMTDTGDVAEDDVHVINTHFSQFIHSSHSIHHTIEIHTIDHHSTVPMAINI